MELCPVAPSPPMAWKERRQLLEALVKFSWRNEGVRLLLCHASSSGPPLRGSDFLRDYGHWAVLCILANRLKETACLHIGRWAPGFMQKHSLCDMDCKKDTALCVRYRQGSCHPGQQGHGTPRSPIKEGLLPSCQECSQQVATAASPSGSALPSPCLPGATHSPRLWGRGTKAWPCLPRRAWL